MVRVCAWCETVLEIVPAVGAEVLITHGICEKCINDVIAGRVLPCLNNSGEVKIAKSLPI